MAAPVEQADLPPFTNHNPRCVRCGNRRLIRVHFDRDCAEARGDHFHRVCPCAPVGRAVYRVAWPEIRTGNGGVLDAGGLAAARAQATP